MEGKEKVIVIDFGGQYNQLVARRVRENHVYCEITSYKTPLDKIKEMNPKGIILTGGPNSVFEKDSATAPKELFEIGVPILGLCYGAQLMMHVLGGKVDHAPEREYGKTPLTVDGADSPLFKGVPKNSIVWMSHNDYIRTPAAGFHITSHTDNCPVASAENPAEKLYFVIDVCGCAGDWQMSSFAEKTIEELREKIGDGKALCALSGGVDSSVAAVLLAKAIGKNLTCVFVDHGLLRKDEGDMVSKVFGPEGPYELNFVRVNAKDLFYSKLKGVTEPEKKRKIIGEEFIRVFEQEAKKIGKVDYLVQGTIYPDVVLVMRQPFPGPGLGIRIIGDITEEKVKIVQDADAIFREEMEKAGLNKTAGQYFAALTNMRSVGVMGDERTYDYAIALRAVNTVDFMTADIVEIPYEVLKTVTSRIINEVSHVNRVLYDITSKPPGTIEFE